MGEPHPFAGQRWPKCIDCPAKGECNDRQCLNAFHRRAGKTVGTDGRPTLPPSVPPRQQKEKEK